MSLTNQQYDRIFDSVRRQAPLFRDNRDAFKELLALEFADTTEYAFALHVFNTEFPSNPAPADDKSARTQQRWTKIVDDESIGTYIPIERLDKNDKGDWEYWRVESLYAGLCRFLKCNTDNSLTKQDAALAKVIAEYHTLGKFSHPNVVVVYDAGKIMIEDTVRAFVATEFLDGETLREWRSKHAATELRAAKIVSVIANAIEALRAFKLVNPTKSAADRDHIMHLDIKPSNIMVLHSDNHEANEKTLKLIDFGSSGTAENALGDGTLHYMAPERFSKSRPHPTWDIFSLGGVLFFLVSGKHPNPPDLSKCGFEDKQQAWNSWLASLKFEDQTFAAICRKCLAYSSKDRYQTPLQLKEDLDAWVYDYPVPHVRRGDYLWWEKECLLWKRSFARNDKSDHSQILGRVALFGALLSAAVPVGHTIQVAFGVAPDVANMTANTPMLIGGILLFVFVLIAVRARRRSLSILEPLIAVLISFFCLQKFVVPAQYLSPPNWEEQNQAGHVALIILGIVVISFGASLPEWKIARPFGWTVLFSAFFVRPLFESQYSSVAMPIAVGVVEVIICLMFAWQLIPAASHPKQNTSQEQAGSS